MSVHINFIQILLIMIHLKKFMLFSQFKNKLKVIFSVICQFVHKPLGEAQKPVQWNIRHQQIIIWQEKS